MENMQLSLVPDGTEEKTQAISLHCEIMAAAQTAASSLLALGRKLKQMKDSGGFRLLGFDSLGAYAEAAVGIRQRQAYTYIQVVEKLPAQLIEENAAAGVTKLALLGQLNAEDRAEVVEDGLADITVKDLKALIEEKNRLGEQLSLLSGPNPGGEEVDLASMLAEAREEGGDAAQAQAEDRIREIEAHHQHELEKLRQKMAAIQREADLDRKEQEDANEAAMRFKKEAEAANKEVGRLQGNLKQTESRAYSDGLKEGERKARTEAEKKIQAQMQKVREEADEEARAEVKQQLEEVAEQQKAMAKELEAAKLASDPDSVRFSILFEKLQAGVQEMEELADRMAGEGKAEQAGKLRGALCGALHALAAEVAE